MIESTQTSSANPASTGQDIDTGQRDLWVPSLYVSAAAILLSLILPMNVHFRTEPVWSLALALAGTVLLLVGTALRSTPLIVPGVAALMGLIAACVITQPSVLNIPVAAIWPVRLSIVLLVAVPWAFLMHPPRILARALVAFALPTFLAILLWGGPATGAALFGWQVRLPARSFSPLWLAVGGQGTLYATDARLGLVWVFDPAGNPRGTIRPAMAPPVSTPGPGIMPVGYEEEINVAGMGLVPKPTPYSGMAGPTYMSSLYFDFCGLAADAQDNLYTVDMNDRSGFKLLRFDRDGTITGRWPTPKDFAPTSNCVAINSEHIYLGSHNGKVYMLDHEGNLQNEAMLSFMPFGISPSAPGKLTAISPKNLVQVDLTGGQTVTVTLPMTQEGQYQTPFLVTGQGQTLVTNHMAGQVVRLDSATGQALGTIGERGYMPGQFGEVAGIAQDAQGRLYVADWLHHVIQRFTPDGKIDAVWWASMTTNIPGAEGEIE